MGNKLWAIGRKYNFSLVHSYDESAGVACLALICNPCAVMHNGELYPAKGKIVGFADMHFSGLRVRVWVILLYFPSLAKSNFPL